MAIRAGDVLAPSRTPRGNDSALVGRVTSGGGRGEGEPDHTARVRRRAGRPGRGRAFPPGGARPGRCAAVRPGARGGGGATAGRDPSGRGDEPDPGAAGGDAPAHAGGG